jgi:hypothetical protein
MLKFILAAGLGAAIAASPVAGFAQTAMPAAKHHATTHHRPTRSYKSEMRQRSNTHKDRARAGAEHMRTMRNQ